MKKSDLKNGMVVENRDGDKFLIMMDVSVYSGDSRENTLLNMKTGCFSSLYNYHMDLTYAGYSSEDIIKVYELNYIGEIFRPDSRGFELLWEREEIKEVTMKELEEILGYPVKIKE